MTIEPLSSLRIAVDLTPLRPGGENGGAKVLVTTLLKQFPKLAPNYNFILLTAPWNHEELTKYETENIRCFLAPDLAIEPPATQQKSATKLNKKDVWLTRKSKKIINKIQEKIQAKLIEYQIEYKLQSQVFKPHKVDLLFCPFSATTYASKNIKVISIVYDLQHLDYPFLFTVRERKHRSHFLGKVVKQAEKIICISEFTRQSMIKNFDVPLSKLGVIPVSIQERFHQFSLEKVSEYLHDLGIGKRDYAFYPANYWLHKNHRMLLTAYSIYRQQFRDRPLDLVFTGSLKEEENKLREAVERMGLKEYVHFLGYLPQELLTAVWQGCKCLVYPSLYEGFGIPTLEAMVFGKPVISSNICSLPEVGGDAVMYFDPRKPEELVSRLIEVSSDRSLATELISKGYQRLKLFSQEEMVLKYLEIFEATACKN